MKIPQLKVEDDMIVADEPLEVEDDPADEHLVLDEPIPELDGDPEEPAI
jgi:hypothetical protein